MATVFNYLTVLDTPDRRFVLFSTCLLLLQLTLILSSSYL